jgi:Zn-dependent alcohol dehydrogenase
VIGKLQWASDAPCIYGMLCLVGNRYFQCSHPCLRSPKRESSSKMASIPRTHRAVVLDAPGSPWMIKSVTTPTPQPGEILIKVLACGVCHSDLHIRQGDMGSHIFPRIPGHEVIGTVVAIGGEGIGRWKVGDRVGGGWHGGHCGECKSCRRGLSQCCEVQLVNGYTRDGGCMFSPSDVSFCSYDADRL